MADDSTVISIDEPQRKLTKNEVLADARVKALESRRRTQKMKLENKLQEVRILLGEISPDHVDRVIQLMADREAELRNKHSKVLGQLHDTIRSEFKKRDSESISMQRRIDTLTAELRALTQAITKKRDDGTRDKTPSAASTKVTTLSALSSLPEHSRKRSS